MADNYLENRMEELRSGKLAAGSRRAAGYGRAAAMPRRGMWQVPFPPRRVLLAANDFPFEVNILKAFLKLDCKVALFNPNREHGETLAHDLGIRFYQRQSDDTEGLKSGFDNLTHAWRGLDIIVCDSLSAPLLAAKWDEYKIRFPIPSDYGGRLIVVANESSDIQNLKGIEEMLRPHGISTNRIIYAANTNPDFISHLSIFLSLPGNHILSGMTFP